MLQDNDREKLIKATDVTLEKAGEKRHVFL